MKLVIHAGAHKAASTSLQVWLRMNKRLLLQSGVLYIEPKELNDSGLLNELHGVTRINQADIFKKLEEFLLRVVQGNRVQQILISHESFFSHSNVTPQYLKMHGFYGDIVKSSSCLDFLSNGFDVRVVYITRSQDKFIESVYLEYLKRGNIAITFSEYIRNIDVEQVSWNYVLSELANHLPSSSLHVIPFEVLIKEPDKFLNYFIDRAGLNHVTGLDNARLTSTNESMSIEAMEIILKLNKFYNPNSVREHGRVIMKIFPAKFFGKAKLLSEELRTEIMSAHSKGNQEVFKRWLFDFSHYRDYYRLM